MTVDGCVANIGSANLNMRSVSLDEEINVVVVDDDLAATLEKQFDEDLDRSVRIEPGRWERRRTFSAWPRPWFAPSGACSEVRQGIGWAGALGRRASVSASGTAEGARRRRPPRRRASTSATAPPPTPYRLVPSRSAARRSRA